MVQPAAMGHASHVTDMVSWQGLTARCWAAARWSIYAVDWQARAAAEERITPAGVDVMTPATAPGAPWLAVAMRSGKDSGFR